MSETKSNRNGMRYTYLGIGVFILVISVYELFKKRNEKYLRENQSATIGTVYGFPTDARKQSVSIEYWYIINGRKLKRSEGESKVLLNNPTPFTSKSFPVVYDSTNPSYSHILIDPADFERYGVTFPDSLRWVLPYFEKNK